MCCTAVSTTARDWLISSTAPTTPIAPRWRRRDAVVGGDHRLGGPLQMSETIGLRRNPVRDFLDVARDVGKLDPETADPVGELIDEPLAVRSARCDIILFHGCCPQSA